ncbi:WD repeat-containing protein 43-like protein [Leptotrombidium deliense]|uniref:WD repeat-containing protein 43-like protein n=1 Tax=Leptotrombidium deliense TaxID=299467 RepID=A0A443SHW3_9ACAR|nr:WD repeat-containing protein 43-like protein [Leptotrombidium deliense]
MQSIQNIPAFSHNDEYFANTTADGIIYFWNSASGQLKNEYKPSSHLSATCSCISWGPSKPKSISTPRKKKRKSTAEDDLSTLELVAIGTENGSILLYSLIKEGIHKKLENGHTNKVNGISWSEEETIYTCSSDKHIIEWNLSTYTVNSKWKADDNEVYSLCYFHDSTLLSASSVIKLWNLKDKSVLRKFTGHANEVWKLLPIISSDSELQSSGYFISAAAGERVLNAWQTKSSPRDRKSLASYTLTDEPVFVDVSKPSCKEEPILIAAVTKSGDLLVFEHLLNGRKNSPIKPKCTVKIATDSKHKNFMPIIGVRNCNDSDHSLLIVYGSVLRPRFEKLSVSSCDDTIILVRDNHLIEAKSVIQVEQKSLKVTEPKTSKGAKVLGPAQMNPAKPVLDSSTGSPRKPSHNKNTELNLPLNERLKALEPETINGDKEMSETPRADNFVHLLMQGLQSKDRRMLDTVLSRGDVNIITNTVKKLPIEYLSSLLSELQHRLYYKGDANLVYLSWLETLLQTKLSIILTLPNIDSQLMPLLELLNIRCDIFDRVYKLKGRLNLMLSQITTETHEDTTKKEALLKYQDSSTEDESDKEDGEDEDDNQIEGLMELNENDSDTDEDTEKDDEDEAMEAESETAEDSDDE